MTTSSILGVVGAGIGFAVGGPAGAKWGYLAGSTLGAIVDRPDGPSPGDLSAPQIAEGSLLSRSYGTTLHAANPVSVSEFTATANDTGGKGGPPKGSAGYTYSLDMLCTVTDVTDDANRPTHVSRVFVNKKLVDVRLASASSASLVASADTTAYTSLTFYDGAANQDPPPVYEAREGVGDVPAYRWQTTVEIVGLNCGGSKTIPVVEVELVKGTAGDAIWRNHVTFGDDTAADTSYYNATPSITGTEGVDYTISDGVFEALNGAGTSALEWSGTHLHPQDGVPITLQAKGCLTVTEQGNTPSLYEYGSGTFVFVIGCNSSFMVDGWRFNIRHPGDSSGSFYGPVFAIGEKHHCELIVTPAITGTTVTGGTIDIYIDGLVIDSQSISTSTIHPTVGFAQILSTATGFTSEGIQVEYAGTAFAALHSANFTPPDDLPPADQPAVIPGPVDLEDVVKAELSINPAIDLADWDTSELAGTEVRGFTAVGMPAKTIAELGDIFYFDLVPGRPNRFQFRGGASSGTIANVDTGVAVDEAKEAFAGLSQDNDTEKVAVVGLSAPNASSDHEPVFRRGDRLTTEGADIEKRRTEVGLTPAETQGRALAATLMNRAMGFTAQYGLSDKYAAAEPGDNYTAVDDQGNTYNKIIRALTYADGVRDVKWELNDVSALIETGITDGNYTPSIVVTAPAVPLLYLFDSPILRDADDGHGIYAAVTASGDWQGAELFLSRDDVTYESVGTFANRGVVGTATELGDFTGWTWDTANSMTVTLDAGTDGLTASTKAAIEADATVNVALVGSHEQWEAVRFANASLLGAETYLLSDFLRGQFGTEHANAEHELGDTFVLMRTTGVIRVPLTSGDLGNVIYLKAAPPGVALSAVTAQSIEYTAEGLKPYAPVDLHVEEESGSTVVSWNRRSRFASSLFGVAPPLGETSESYDVELYDGVTLEVSETVTEPEWEVQGLAEFFTLGRSGQDIREVNGDLLTLRESTDLSNGAVDVLDASDGSVIDGEPLGEQTKQLADDGAVVFVATVNGSLASHLFRYDPASIGTPTHTYTGTLAADVQGVAFDGTDVWVSEFYSGQVRQIDASDLTVLNTYSITGAPGRMFFDGSLWVCMAGGLDVAEIDISDGSVVQRVPVGGVPLDVVVAGGFVFVQTGSAINVYSDSTGALVASEAVGSITTSRAAHLALFDGFAVGADPSTGELVFMSTTAGLFAKRMPLANLRGLSGSTASLLFATTFAGFHETVALADSALTGKTVTVYQNSAAVGRGYPAEVEL
jgi:hypothetical protein